MLVFCSFLGACARPEGAAPMLPSTTARHELTRDSSNYATLFAFSGWNGADAMSQLTYFNGRLYGTTRYGGLYSWGSVFSISLTGVEKLIYSFRPIYDGVEPMAGLTALDGMLYGTTYTDAYYERGTVFSISPTGKERVLHVFGQKDGQNPMAALTVLNGLLYGTTIQGGAHNGGSVFSITKSGTFRVIHSFGYGEGNDGSSPFGGLTVYNGILYGTTFAGGKCNGTIFSVTPSGKEQVLYDFGCKPGDGAEPGATMIVRNGTFYGTTEAGGKVFYNAGIVFSFTPPRTERILYTFYGTNPPARPKASLVEFNGLLYGTTSIGGENNYGTIFSLTPSGSLNVLYSFGSPPDGRTPEAGLTAVKNTLYGTTTTGGGFRNSGTIFTLSP